jgi:hypothetical protein
MQAFRHRHVRILVPQLRRSCDPSGHENGPVFDDKRDAKDDSVLGARREIQQLIPPRQFYGGWKDANLRTEMLRSDGISSWPRLLHLMRASRQTELQREFPIHVVCSWLGNSPQVAQQSYLLVTEDDFARAAGMKRVMVEG